MGGANHTTRFTRQPGPTTLADGQDQMQVRYVAQAQNGVSLETTYTISRGSYVIDVQHRVSNTTAQPDGWLHSVHVISCSFLILIMSCPARISNRSIWSNIGHLGGFRARDGFV